MTAQNLNLNIPQCESQKARILEWLLLGLPLTPLDALKYFNCLKLSNRISELKEEGFPIITETVSTKSHKRIARYRI